METGGPDAAKYSWCRVAKGVVEGAGFAQEWAEAKVAGNWKKAVRELCEKRLKGDLRRDVGSHSSLELFQRVGRFSGVDPWLRLELRHPGRALKVRLRAGALPLMVHVGVSNMIKERRMRRCVMCNSGEVETEEHFVAQCPYYDELRARCCSRLKGLSRLARSNPRAWTSSLWWLDLLRPWPLRRCV